MARDNSEQGGAFRTESVQSQAEAAVSQARHRKHGGEPSRPAPAESKGGRSMTGGESARIEVFGGGSDHNDCPSWGGRRLACLLLSQETQCDQCIA